MVKLGNKEQEKSLEMFKITIQLIHHLVPLALTFILEMAIK
jgi:hypothetical protein